MWDTHTPLWTVLQESHEKITAGVTALQKPIQTTIRGAERWTGDVDPSAWRDSPQRSVLIDLLVHRGSLWVWEVKCESGARGYHFDEYRDDGDYVWLHLTFV